MVRGLLLKFINSKNLEIKYFRHLSIILVCLISINLISACSDSSSGPRGGEIEVAPPPFEGTVYISENIITEEDENRYESLTYKGRENRKVYDETAGGTISRNIYLFNVSFSNGHTAEVLGDEAFANTDSVANETEKYLIAIGRMPNLMLNNLDQVIINKSSFRTQGSTGEVIIYTESESSDDGYLEETFFHEGVHVALDSVYNNTANWRTAQREDPTYISTYARDNSNREDLAESCLPYFAVRFRPSRISASTKSKIIEAMPNRMAYFDSLVQNIDMYPYAAD